MTFSHSYDPDRGIDVQRHNPRFGASAGTVNPPQAPQRSRELTSDVVSRWATSCVTATNPVLRECLQRDLAAFVGWRLVRWEAYS